MDNSNVMRTVIAAARQRMTIETDSTESQEKKYSEDNSGRELTDLCTVCLSTTACWPLELHLDSLLQLFVEVNLGW